MKPGSLWKKLKREAKANPGKAVILGIVAVVALYFWVPLVWGWVGKSNANAGVEVVQLPPTAAISPSPTDPSVAPASPSPSIEHPSWLQIAQGMENDPRTKTALPLTTTRDPFQSPQALEEDSKKAADSEELKPRFMTPAEAGLVLTSTVTGAERRIAQINGKTYTEGQTIPAAKDSTRGVSFTLVEIQPRRVVLEADSQRYDLTIPEPGKTSNIEISGTTSD